MLVFLILLAAFLVALRMYLVKVYSRFSRYGVNSLKPVPFLGNVGDLALKRRHISQNFQALYNAFPHDRFMGRFELMRPIVMVRDLELIKLITVKDFEYFLDHRVMVDESVDPLFGRNLFSIKGQEWKDMRSTLSPAFTTAKMRAMVPFMQDVNKQMIKTLKKKLEQSKCEFIDVDSKDLASRYSNDVIASCGFGLMLDSHTDLSNEFFLHAKSTAHFGFRRVLVYLGYSSFPNLMKKLKIKLLSEEANQYFSDLFLTTMLERKNRNIIRPDLIHLLLEAKRAWSNTDLVAQLLLFFLAGFETVSTAINFVLYELAVNPDVQDRLLVEIRDNERRNKGFDYDSLQSLKYLDMVVSEVLRLWPPGPGIDRVCTKDYSLGRPNSTAKEDFTIHKGEIILVPIHAIHHDPKYFPDPEKFDPERFSEKNRDKIKPYTYLPFGSGPRGCIGYRFALCEIKVVTYELLLNFQVLPAERTRVPAQLEPSAFTLNVEGGSWIRLKARM